MAKKAKSPTQPPAKPKAPPAPAKAATSPMINTDLAAAAAARMVAGKAATPPMTDANRKETALFKQMKEGLAKPAAQTVSSMLEKSGPPGQKKSATPFAAGNQVGHNQTQGGFNKINVPRRTGG